MNLIAACAFGLEALVKRELLKLGYADAKVIQPGRIQFQGDYPDICRTNLWLRTADRVLIEALRFPAADFDALFEVNKAFEWAQQMPADANFPVDAKTRNSQLTSVPAIQRTVKKAIVESLLRGHATNTLEETGPRYRIEVSLLDDEATVTIDTTGPSLHKRGYRKLSAAAPLKESLAAALVQLSVWNPDRTLIDPFCGSGTIPIEAALIGLNIAPGLNREFSCSGWPSIRADLWRETKAEAVGQQVEGSSLQIIGTDRDASVLELARYHAKLAGVDSQIHFQQKQFEQLRSKREYGCIITNPPYGERLSSQASLDSLYQSIPSVIQRLPTWSLFLITNYPKFEKTIQKKADRRRKLYNGRIECTYFQFLGPRPPRNGAKPSESKAKDQEIAPQALFGGIEAKDLEQAKLFENRLAKRARHLRRWPKRGISCYRIYERDIPEIPLVVDRYDDLLHITEYERPHERDLARHASWLELMMKTAAATLEIPIQHVFMKRRAKDSQSRQYGKFGSGGKRFEVHENGLSFLVNLSDYVDTGLFLDHRKTRQMVRDDAQGKDFLNLFAYTGSFSVYAAAGNANSTTTVDLSHNYLDWAKDNMATNGFVGPQYQYIAADTMEFLKHGSSQLEECFDLAVVDPPTYSNSKRTDGDWDVQKQHAELLNLLLPALRKDGIVYFSTNFRRFKLEEEAIKGYEFREISKQTVPDDFRNKRIHRCWKLRKL